MKLCLFFTRGVSLNDWVVSGLFDREKLIYEMHLTKKTFEKIYWISYGTYDKEIANELKKEKKLHSDIEILQMPKMFNIPKIGTYLYSLLIPIIHYKIIKNCNILKTNQMDGSWSGLLSKILCKKKLINRTGYTLSIFLKKQNVNKIKIMIYQFIENLLYQYSDINIVASNQDKNYLGNKYNIELNKIHVLHNYIDTNLFTDLQYDRIQKFIFVGRLNEQKNLFNLIDAIGEMGYELDIYGKGELENVLKDYSKKYKNAISFNGVIENKKLPHVLNRYKYYVLSSYYEGMPKTLLEAMSCGCICIGTDVDGINEVINNNENGFLAKTISKNDIKDAINNSLNSTKQIKKNAIQKIKDEFSLMAIFEKELNVIKKLQ